MRRPERQTWPALLAAVGLLVGGVPSSVCSADDAECHDGSGREVGHACCRVAAPRPERAAAEVGAPRASCCARPEPVAPRPTSAAPHGCQCRAHAPAAPPARPENRVEPGRPAAWGPIAAIATIVAPPAPTPAEAERVGGRHPCRTPVYLLIERLRN